MPLCHVPSSCPWSHNISRGIFSEMDGTPRKDLPVPYLSGLSRSHEPGACALLNALLPGAWRCVCTGDEASHRPLPAHWGLPSTFLGSVSVLLNTCKQGFMSGGGPGWASWWGLNEKGVHGARRGNTVLERSVIM